MVERGDRYKDSYKCVSLSCILAVSSRHNGNLEGTALDVPEAIRGSLRRVALREWRRRGLPEGRRWNEHLQIVVSRCKDLEAKGVVCGLSSPPPPPGRGVLVCPSVTVAVRLVL